MKKFANGVKKFVREEDAPTMVEYGLLVVVIALVALVGARLVGSSLSTLFTNVSNDL